MSGMGSHERTHEGLSKIWLTPPHILENLGAFDLDPCAAPSPRPWSVAKRHIELPECGLTAEWDGRVFLNPPYSATMTPWMQKMAAHKNGIALIFARTETAIWTKYVWPVADSILFLHGRLSFHRPNGMRDQTSNAGAPSALVAYTQIDTAYLSVSGIKGHLVTNAQRLGMA